MGPSRLCAGLMGWLAAPDLTVPQVRLDPDHEGF
jgi:hypothetical protein